MVFSHRIAVTEGMDVGAQILARANSVLDQHPFYIPTQILSTFGPKLVGIPVLIWMAVRRIHLFAPIGAAVMLMPYLINILIVT